MEIFTPNSINRGRCSCAAATLLVVSTIAVANEPPRKPTPKPGTLGAYAEKITLDRSSLGNEDQRIILTNDNVLTVGADGLIIIGGGQTNNRRESKPGVADRAERERWRAAHHKQRNVISSLERRRTQLDIEISHIENQSLTVKTMARLQRTEAKLRQLDRDIGAARAELGRIVREARKRGAEPGWFR